MYVCHLVNNEIIGQYGRCNNEGSIWNIVKVAYILSDVIPFSFIKPD